MSVRRSVLSIVPERQSTGKRDVLFGSATQLR
jgi:hypothetical protein